MRFWRLHLTSNKIIIGSKNLSTKEMRIIELLSTEKEVKA